MFEEQKREVVGADSTTDEIKMALQQKVDNLNQGLVNMSISNNTDNYYKITLATPEGKERVNNDIICVLDISGSMAQEAHVKNSDGQKERHGLSYLDLLKHATKTIIMTLKENDRFALISYSSSARLEYNLEYMTEENKNLAIMALDNLHDEECTNIWKGIQMAMELCEKMYSKDQHQSIMLLTDGEPNEFPPSGYIPTLKNYKKYSKGFKFNINTFAFGKHIDTPLLDQYAQIGNGQYCFIPCPGFIGTVFVNSIANILNTMGSRCQLKIELLNGCKLMKVGGGLPYEQDKKNKNLYTIEVGDLKFCQPRDIVVQLQLTDQLKQQQQDQAPVMNISVDYYDFISKKQKIGQVTDYVPQYYRDPFLDAHFCRVLFVEEVRKAWQEGMGNNFKGAQEIIAVLSKQIQIYIEQLEKEQGELQGINEKEFMLGRVEWSLEFLKNLKKDVDGEVTLAVAKDYSFKHWGKHFLPSLNHCHLKQQCNNFCDPGIQNYGLEFFQEIKGEAEMTFLRMPAPKPSKRPADYNPYQKNTNKKKNNNNNQQQYTYQVKQDPQPQKQVEKKEEDNNGIDMNDYYNCGGGCFAGESLVKLQSGEQKIVCDIQQGDIILTKEGEFEKIKTVVKIQNSQKNLEVVELGENLVLTPQHPVFNEGKWVKPSSLGKIVEKQIDAVYNFELESGNNLEIGGIYCVTLGHGIQEQDAYHAYFGSQKVINDIQTLEGYSNGYVEIKMTDFMRKKNSSSDSICGLRPVLVNKSA